MSNLAAICRRELGVYFVSPVAYIILTFILLLAGANFTGRVSEFSAQSTPMTWEPVLMWIAFVVALSSALVTMRLLAEEKSRGTLEIMLTAPVTEFQFVAGKFLATLLLLVYLVLPTAAYPILLSPYGQVDVGALACGYLGILLVGAVVYSIGLFISSLCTSQVTAGFVTFMVSIALFILQFLAPNLDRDSVWLGLLRSLDLYANLLDFLRGVLDTGRLTYLLSVVVFFLFVTVRVVESRRWR